MAEKCLYETQRQAHIVANDYAGKMACKSMDDLRRMERMLKLAEPRLAVRLELLNQQPDLLAVKNGTINLATGELLKSKPELCEQMRVADRRRLIKQIGYLDPRLIPQLDEAITITLGLKRL